MRRSFGGNQGGMGGGNGNSGGVLRPVARAVTRAKVGALQESFSSSSSNTHPSTQKRNAHKPNSTNLPILSIKSTPFSLPFSENWPHCDEFEWVDVDHVSEDDGDVRVLHGYFDELVLGSVPSLDEVQTAVSGLQHAEFVRDMFATCSDKDTSPTALSSELDWMEPSMQFCNSEAVQPYGSNRVYDAFHLLQTDKSVQRMVISLSSDKAVWDAVMNNEVIRELKDSLDSAEDFSKPSSDEGSDSAMGIMKWILDNTKAKAAELIQTIMKLVNHLLQGFETEKTGEGAMDNPFEEKLRSSFLLTIVVLLIVVVSRSHSA